MLRPDRLGSSAPRGSLWGVFFLTCLLTACTPTSPYRRHDLGLPAWTAPVEAEPKLAVDKHLRVLLQRGSRGLRISAKGGLKLCHPLTGQTLAEMGAGTKVRLSARHGLLNIRDEGLGLSEARLEALNTGQAVQVSGRSFRGEIRVRAAGDEVLVVNSVSLEQYLYGVLPSEVPSDWPLEALKAQAVAARSYAMWRTKKGGSAHYDLDDSTASQVYLGSSGEHARARQAVDATEGQVLFYRGQLVQAFFHSNSGGYTADAEDVWGSPLPYLRSVSDPWSEDQKHYAWSGTVKKAELSRLLARSGLWEGTLDDVRPLERDESGRFQKVLLSGAQGEKQVKCTAFRAALGADLLRSTNFKVRQKGDALEFEGLGWGHGVGLAQEGALVMASRGYGFERILQTYYPGTHLASLP